MVMFDDNDFRFRKARPHFDLRITFRAVGKWPRERDTGDIRSANVADFKRNGQRLIREGTGTVLARDFGLFDSGDQFAILDDAASGITEQSAQTDNNFGHGFRPLRDAQLHVRARCSERARTHWDLPAGQ